MLMKWEVPYLNLKSKCFIVLLLQHNSGPAQEKNAVTMPVLHTIT